MLPFLDILLYSIHIIVILSNMFLWIWQRTRKVHLVVILATAFSWFVMGIWYGWGYCFLTDWEWDIKRQLGENDLPNSFIHYLANNTLSLNISAEILDGLTLVVFIIAFFLSVILNIMDYKANRLHRL